MSLIEAEGHDHFLDRLVVVKIGDHPAQVVDLARILIGFGVRGIGFLTGLVGAVESIAGTLIGRHGTFIGRAEPSSLIVDLLFLLVYLLVLADPIFGPC